MGFINYHGDKEDRYTDVVEFAKAQQEEEKRRVSDERTAKWISDFLGNPSFKELNVRELLKCIIKEYRCLKEKYDHLTGNSEGYHLDTLTIWKDFCSSLVAKKMAIFSIPDENKETTYNTFMSRVFNFAEFTHYCDFVFLLESSKAYKQYFSECYDIFCENYFLNWLKASKKNVREFEGFIDAYKVLSVYLSYYMFQVFRPEDDGWMKKLEIEDKAIKTMCKGSLKQITVNIALSKLVNPIDTLKEKGDMEKVSLPEPAKAGQPVLQDVINNTTEPNPEPVMDEKEKRKPLDVCKLEKIIESRNLDSYTEACQMILEYGTTERIDSLYANLKERIPVLKEALDRFKDQYKDIYQPKMFQFYEFYFPEMIRITVSYTEYAEIEIGDKIKREVEESTISAIERVLNGVNDIIDNIYQFAAMDLKARSKALGSKMELDGHAYKGIKVDG